MADIFDVIADGTRRDILRLLLDRASAGERGTSVSHIVQELGASQPTVSKHLKVLREAHLVSVREDGQHRYYSLSAAPLDEVDDWLVPFLDDDSGSDYSAVSPLTESAAESAEQRHADHHSGRQEVAQQAGDDVAAQHRARAQRHRAEPVDDARLHVGGDVDRCRGGPETGAQQHDPGNDVVDVSAGGVDGAA